MISVMLDRTDRELGHNTGQDISCHDRHSHGMTAPQYPVRQPGLGVSTIQGGMINICAVYRTTSITLER